MEEEEYNEEDNKEDVEEYNKEDNKEDNKEGMEVEDEEAEKEDEEVNYIDIKYKFIYSNLSLLFYDV